MKLILFIAIVLCSYSAWPQCADTTDSLLVYEELLSELSINNIELQTEFSGELKSTQVTITIICYCEGYQCSTCKHKNACPDLMTHCKDWSCICNFGSSKTLTNDEIIKSVVSDTPFIEQYLKNDIAALYNNTPNPFYLETNISFYIPNHFHSASLIIHDMQGEKIKSFEINQPGKGSVKLNGSELEPGIYLYTLIIDHKIIDTKKMVLKRE